MRISRAFLLRWHRRIGLTAALFITFILVTGFLLNHARLFGLDQIRLEMPWLLSFYNMEVPKDYLVGAAEVNGIAIAALRDGVALFTPNGELIERIPAASLPPGPITRLALQDEIVILYTEGGPFMCDADFTACTETALAGQPAETASLVIEDAVARLYHGGGLSLEKILLDIHTGRIFGVAGALFTDLVALALLMLVVSGVYNGMRRR